MLISIPQIYIVQKYIFNEFNKSNLVLYMSIYFYIIVNKNKKNYIDLVNLK